MTAEERRNKRIREKQKRDLVNKNIVLTQLLSSVEGRRYLWNELSSFNVFAQSEELVDSHPRLAFFEGKRSVGLRLLADINRVNPGYFSMMMKENVTADKEETDDGPDDDASGDADSGRDSSE